MPILGSLMPGLRDLRAPLVTGYLWLATLWILVRHWIPGGRLGVLVQDVRDLCERAGIGPSIAILSFAAYLVGVVATVDWIPNKLIHKIALLDADITSEFGLQRTPAFEKHNWWLRFLRGTIPERGTPRDRVAWKQVTRLIDAGRTPFDVVNSTRDLAFTQRFRIKVQLRVNQYASTVMLNLLGASKGDENVDGLSNVIARLFAWEIDEEFDALVNRLQVERPTIFDRYDRMVAESQFRIACSWPLCALSLVLTGSTWNPLFLILGALFAAVVFVNGVRRGFDARAVVWDALDQDHIRLPLLETHRKRVSQILKHPEKVEVHSDLVMREYDSLVKMVLENSNGSPDPTLELVRGATWDDDGFRGALCWFAVRVTASTEALEVEGIRIQFRSADAPGLYCTQPTGVLEDGWGSFAVTPSILFEGRLPQRIEPGATASWIVPRMGLFFSNGFTPEKYARRDLSEYVEDQDQIQLRAEVSFAGRESMVSTSLQAYVAPRMVEVLSPSDWYLVDADEYRAGVAKWSHDSTDSESE